MLTRLNLRDQEGSVVVIALLVMTMMLPLGVALLAIVDTQARQSGTERTRDRAFNLADSALTSAAVNLGRFGWPASGASAPSNAATGTAGVCSTSGWGATLGGATTSGSATSKLQPNLNASYTDSAYVGATWQINVCDDDPLAAGPTVWKAALLNGWNYDANANDLVWIHAQATVAGRTRVLAALVGVAKTPALSSKYGLMTGRMNADVTNTVGTILGGGLLSGITDALLGGTQPLVKADPLANTTPPTSGVTAVRCGLLDINASPRAPATCLTGALAATSALPLLGPLVTGDKLVQATSLTAASDASIAQLKQQAIASGTYKATSPGASYPALYADTFLVSKFNPPLCDLPTGAGPNTVVYIAQVGTGDQACRIDLPAGGLAYKALVIGRGRVVLRGDGTNTGRTFSGVLYALNQQRDTLGDSASSPREVIRLEKDAHVRGGGWRPTARVLRWGSIRHRPARLSSASAASTSVAR